MRISDWSSDVCSSDLRYHAWTSCMPSAPPWNRRSLRPESATGARMQPAAATNPAQIRLRCPRCGTGIPDSQCPACRFVVTVGRGIVRALSPESQAHPTGFMDEYERIREAEGRGSERGDFYLALPYVDAPVRDAGQWHVSARRPAYVLRHLLRGTGQRHEPMLLYYPQG